MDHSIEMIVLSVAGLLLFVASFLLGVVCIFLRGKVRDLGTTVLMVLSTLLFVVLYLAGQKGNDDLMFGRNSNIDKTTLDLGMHVGCSTRLAEQNYPFIRPLIENGFALNPPERLFSTYRDYLNEVQKSHWDDVAAGGLALLARELNEDPCSALVSVGKSTAKEDKKSAEADELEIGPETVDGANSVRSVIHMILCEKNTQSSADIASAERVLNKKFPEGWRRTVALMSLYKRSGQQARFETLQREYEHTLETGSRMILAIVICRCFIALGGVVALVMLLRRLMKDGLKSTEFNCPEFSFKAMYAIPLLIVYTQVAIGIPIGIVYAVLGKEVALALNAPLNILLNLCGLVATFVAIYLMILRPRKLSFGDLQLSIPRAKTVQVCFSGLAGYLIVISTITIATALLFHFMVASSNNPVVKQVLTTVPIADPLLLFGVGLGIVIVAPVSEELIFRGLLYTWLRRKYGVLAAVFGSGAIFAAYHFDPAQFFFLWLAGAVFAVVYERSRSLVAPMLSHMLMNATWFLTVVMLSLR